MSSCQRGAEKGPITDLLSDLQLRKPRDDQRFFSPRQLAAPASSGMILRWEARQRSSRTETRVRRVAGTSNRLREQRVLRDPVKEDRRNSYSMLHRTTKAPVVMNILPCLRWKTWLELRGDRCAEPSGVSNYRAHPYIRLNYLASRHSARRCIPACARRILIKARAIQSRGSRYGSRGVGGSYIRRKCGKVSGKAGWY
jgi:hypothetical protein